MDGRKVDFLNNVITVSMIKKCPERTMTHECWGSHRKCQEHWQRYWKWFPVMLPKGLRMPTKVCHCPRELLWRKYCVNRCTVTSFCVINQFWKLLKLVVCVFISCATSILIWTRDYYKVWLRKCLVRNILTTLAAEVNLVER